MHKEHGHLEKLEPGGEDSWHPVLSPLVRSYVGLVVGAAFRDLGVPE